MPPAEPSIQDQSDTPGPDDEPDSSASETGDLAKPIRVELIPHTDIAETPIDGWLGAMVAKAIGLCGVKQAELNLVIVADDEMAQLHEQYTGVLGTTDVLTFDMAEGGLPPELGNRPVILEGDIILCLDEAKRQADQRNHPIRHELLLYAIHGLLHLLGEDDHDEAAYQRMHAREDELLQALGIGRVFNPSSDTNS